MEIQEKNITVQNVENNQATIAEEKNSQIVQMRFQPKLLKESHI